MSIRTTATKIDEMDRQTVMLMLALIATGWLMIYAVNYNPKDPLAFFDLNHSAGKQLFFIVVCFVLVFIIINLDWAIWRTFGLVIWLLSQTLLIAVLFGGTVVNGARAWFQFGGFSFQPAEIVKFATCLGLSAYLSSTGVNLREWKNRMYAFSIVLVPILLILLQPDAGSALVFFSFLLVLYREGLGARWYVLGFSTAALVILGLIFPPPYVISGLMMVFTARLISQFRNNQVWWVIFALLLPLTWFWQDCFVWFLKKSAIDPASVVPDLDTYLLIPHFILFVSALAPSYLKKNNLIQKRLQLTLLMLVAASALVFFANFFCFSVLKPHQQERIKVWLRPQECDPRGSLYNVLHSKMAIGSGGLLGKGFLEGNMTKLKYVPEQSTDFIFCTIGEEQGFIGVAAVVVLFFLLLYRITILAERQRSNFSRIYAYCVVGILFVHVTVNIGMTMGLFPIIGIPLPFISYGGSSLIGFSLMMGVLLKLDIHRNSTV